MGDLDTIMAYEAKLDQAFALGGDRVERIVEVFKGMLTDKGIGHMMIPGLIERFNWDDESEVQKLKNTIALAKIQGLLKVRA